MTTDTSPTVRERALSVILASRARVAVLRVFMLDPTRSYYQRQLEQATGLQLRAVQREVERLSSVGLLYRRAEGNRAYYQVDTDFVLYPELRGMILKAGRARDRLRGAVAVDPFVRLAFLAGGQERALIVGVPGRRPRPQAAGGLSIEVMSSEEFLSALENARESLAPFLKEGVDLLGRRDDVIWRRIEAAGYMVQKGEGVP